MKTPRYDRLTLGELGTNCYLLYDDAGHTVVVDPADDAETILERLTKQGLTAGAVVLTHGHFDHFLAAAAVCRATGAPLLAPMAEQETLADPQRNLSVWVTPQRLAADRWVAEGEVIEVGAVRLTVWETPGHTPGGCCYRGDGLLLTGDTLFADSVGRTDFPGGDAAVLRRSLARLAASDGDALVLPGHGDITTLARERQMNPYMREDGRV